VLCIWDKNSWGVMSEGQGMPAEVGYGIAELVVINSCASMSLWHWGLSIKAQRRLLGNVLWSQGWKCRRAAGRCEEHLQSLVW